MCVRAHFFIFFIYFFSLVFFNLRYTHKNQQQHQDYDKDGFIGQSDLKSVIEALTRNELTPEEHQQIVEKVLEEADVDGDGKLSFLEFDHVVTRAPDFLNTFHIRL